MIFMATFSRIVDFLFEFCGVTTAKQPIDVDDDGGAQRAKRENEEENKREEN